MEARMQTDALRLSLAGAFTQPIRRGPLNSLAPRSEFFAESVIMVRLEIFPRDNPRPPATIKSLEAEIKVLKKQVDQLVAENIALVKTLLLRRSRPKE
jgi:hypothetical protein